ncbi:hypothetical protein PM082_007164 [Marasmius tenuissimus]|nr:hypothetical protein PM082_007164 [Marasmius tenuissimus]
MENGPVSYPVFLEGTTSPAWLSRAWHYIVNVELGPYSAPYRELQRIWIRLEQAHDWKASGSSQLKGARPRSVQMFISAKAKRWDTTPAIDDQFLAVFPGEMWKWWCSLQPGWRGSPIGNRPPPLPQNAGQSWGKDLVKLGQSGWVLFVVAMQWWALGLIRTTDVQVKEKLEEDWQALVNDIVKTGSEVIKSKSLGGV